MKKKLFKVKDFKRLNEIRQKIQDSFTEEGAAAAAAIRELIDEIENSEVEVDEEEFARQVIEIVNGSKEVPEAVANAIAKKFAEVKNAVTDPKQQLTQQIKNKIAAAILTSRGRDEIRDNVNKVLVENGVSGLTFEETVDFAIVENWGSTNRLFAALRKSPITKFYYTTQDVTDSGVLAHEWAKTDDTEKIAQAINALSKTINTRIIYKRLPVDQEDLLDMRDAGDEANFLRWVSDELDRQIVNTIVGTILGSITTVININGVTVWEPLMGNGSTDAFRTAVSTTATSKAQLEITDVRKAADAVSANGKAKWLVIDQTTLTQISVFHYSENGDPIFHNIEELKGMLGVDDIFITNLATNPIVFVPDGYWWKDKGTIDVAYPTWEYNKQNYQKERKCGGAVHDLKSVAFFDYAE